MYFLTALTCLTLGTAVMISCNLQLKPNSFTSIAPVRTYFQKTDSQPNNLQNSRRTDVSVTVKLVPYQMSNGEATSYADVSLTISNTTGRNVELEVTRLEIVASGSEQVLMSST